ncbi:hypothetical protein L5515_003933 [Caenorhabditis briggsae]|uniref:Uncharacterized protein n=1 Tax=Caenorhabditis briggsae TaxID=6238 RepID=A0AAE9IPD8_CAEBR|nr:hypothetical protein L3Y34_001080 [Caenorhabditis briggsae]UMM23006.1 hypothetical protein L5515_003933 [Caenorhabditis briggsae]
MNTNTFITCFLILSLIFSIVDSRISTKEEVSPRTIVFGKNSERPKRDYPPRSVMDKNHQSALQWRPKNLQPRDFK